MELKVTHTNVWEPMGGALQLCAVYKNRIFTAITRETVQVLQVTRTVSEHAMKSKVCMILVPSYTEKISLNHCRWHYYLCCALVTIQTAMNS